MAKFILLMIRYSRASVNMFRGLGLTVLYRSACKSVGAGSKFQQSVYIMTPSKVSFGDDCFVACDVVMTTESSFSGLNVSDGVQINKGVRIDYTGDVEIARHVLISENCIIYSHSHGDNPRSAAQPFSKVIGDSAWIGAGSIIMPTCRVIGAGSIVGAGSVVTKDVPAGAVVAGNPARVIRQNFK